MSLQLRLKSFFDSTSIKKNDLPAKLGVSRSTLFAYLGGKNDPPAHFFMTLKQVFPEVDLNWLLSGVHPKNSELDRDLLKMVIHVVLDHEERHNIRLTAHQVANTITILYEEAYENQALRRELGQQLEQKSIQERLLDKVKILMETFRRRNDAE